MSATPSLEDLVRQICEGTPIDWEGLERDASPGFLNKLAALKLVESVARVHRRSPAEGREAAGIDEPPRRWGHLELLEHLASGAFGDVYRASDQGLDREVALKLLRTASDAEAWADEAVDEGRVLARLHHPNIVSVYGAARHEGRVGIWMEYIRGRTLADVIRQDGPLPAARVAEIGVALCAALEAVHRANLVHRDVKAQNVMLTPEGRVVLMDFGAGRDRLHAALDLAGTPAYLAPEVARGEPATPRSDIYSLGVLLRFLATGTVRPTADSRPSDGHTRRLLDILRRASAADPNARFETAEALACGLRTLAGTRKNLVAMAVAATLVIGSLVILWATLWRSPPGDSSRRVLEQSWRAAIPTRVGLSPEQSQISVVGTLSTFSFHGALPGTMPVSAFDESLVTSDLRSGNTRVWLTYPRTAGHAGALMVSPDDSLLAYAWDDHTCGCFSLRTVDRTGRIRTLVSDRDVVTIVGGSSVSRLLPVLIGHKTSGFQLSVVDIGTGVQRVLRGLPTEPTAFGVSPDGRFVAFDLPRGPAPGSSRNIVILEVSSGREWPLIQEAGDRVLPIWAPRGEQLLYLESPKTGGMLSSVRIVDGHRASEPAVLRRGIKPMSIGFVDDDTFAYWLGTGGSDLMVVEAGPDGSFRDQKPRRVSQGAMMPAWSPDGRWLAWSDFTVRAGGIRVTGADDRVVRAFQPTLNVQVMPTWSDDSRQLVFLDLGNYEGILKVADVATGVTRDILRSPSGVWPTVAWLPGGRELLMMPDGKHIVAVDVSTGRQREIHAAPPSDDIGPLFVSPDGQSLLFCEGHEEPSPIHVIPLGPRGLSVVLPASRAESEALLGWWPDGTLFETRMPDHPVGLAPNELWRRPLDGTPPQPLGVSGPGIYYASAALDGKRIAYVTQTFGQDLWLLKPTEGH
jgi:serine/threonine protein kinase/Tol biopolymer transport system component